MLWFRTKAASRRPCQGVAREEEEEEVVVDGRNDGMVDLLSKWARRQNHGGA